MKGTIAWLLAFGVTVLAAMWQRLSGPTWPVKGQITVATLGTVRYRLPRSAEVGKDLRVSITLDGNFPQARVRYRRVPSRDPWQEGRAFREGQELVAFLPEQPAAGKLAYQFVVDADGGSAASVLVPPEPVVVRFKGHVPAVLLLPHIVAMFLGMLFANRSGLAGIFSENEARRYAWLALGFLVGGGLVLGPLVQKAAFEAYWTGFPVGRDLTDTKTLAVVLVWLWAAVRGGERRRWAFLVAAVVTLAVFSIPHSLLGSEIDWTARE